MTTRFLLVRHAEAEGNAAGQTQGRREVALTERGHAQAATVARSLVPYAPVALYASPATRAQQTARVIAGALGLDVVADERLHELDHGLLDGLTSEELRRDHASFLERWRTADLETLQMPGGETMGEARARMLAALDEYAQRHGDADVVVVSHNLALKSLLAHAIGVPMNATRHFQVDLASLTVVERRAPDPEHPQQQWSVVTLNERCHLPDETPSTATAARRRPAS